MCVCTQVYSVCVPKGVNYQRCCMANNWAIPTDREYHSWRRHNGPREIFTFWQCVGHNRNGISLALH